MNFSGEVSFRLTVSLWILLFFLHGCSWEPTPQSLSAGSLPEKIDSIPVLFFSDLVVAPSSGWEGSQTLGAAVTIWGKNFGPSRGQSVVTVNGTVLDNNSSYAEWGTTGTERGISLGLERITFWLNSSCKEGEGSITLTVNGHLSNPLPFRVGRGRIYFISCAEGADHHKGRKASGRRGDGPWRRLMMISPSNNSSLRPGDIIYIRGGNYVEEDDEDMLAHFRGGSGLSSQPFAVVGFPGEMPILDLRQASRGAFYSETRTLDHWVFSKLKFVNGGAAIGLAGTDLRVIGCNFSRMNREAWTGMIMVDTSQDVSVFGNYFDHCGYDMYLHQIYIKTHDASGFGARQQAERVDVGWNEFDSWTADLNSALQTKPSRGGAIEIQTESTAYNKGKRTNLIRIHDNYFHDGDSHALYIAESKDIVIFNNIFSRIKSRNGAVHIAVGSDHHEILLCNNTFYLSASSPGPLLYVMNQSVARLQNNIFVAAQEQPFATVEAPALFLSDHDLYWGGVPLQGSQFKITHSLSADPQFLVPGVDFHLKPSSPAMDSGTSDVQRWVKSDLDGKQRPLGKEYSLGAYEAD